MNWYLDVLRKYAVFSGRARRKEYWYFHLFNILVAFFVGVLDVVFGTFDPELALGYLSTIYVFTILIPTIAVAIRRLHDIGRSAWWLLLVFIPLIGSVVLFIFMLLDSNPGHNQYGDNPKEPTL